MSIKYTHTEISTFAKGYHKLMKLPGMRKTLISKLDQGISQKKKDRLGIDFQVEDKEKDEYSLKILINWKTLSKSEQLDYCQWLVDTSEEVYIFASSKKENFKQKLRNKNPFAKKND